jgi:hypothetical protein
MADQRRKREVLVDQDHAGPNSVGELWFGRCDLRQCRRQGAIPSDPLEVGGALIAQLSANGPSIIIMVMYGQAAEPVSKFTIH